jgi:serine O-acetyltransferase
VIPSGLRAVRADFKHYSRIHGADTLLERCMLPLREPALLALAVYRFGRWVHHGPGRRRARFRVVYGVLAQLARHITRVLLPCYAELGEETWIESHAPVFVAAVAGRGLRVHAGATLGAGILGGVRGLPRIGDGVVIGPGAVISGPVRIPSGCVIGPNTVVSRTLTTGGGWLGIPAQPWSGPTAALAPAAESER